MLVTCPHCGALAFDDAIFICTKCGHKGIAGLAPVFDEEMLDAYLHNVRAVIATMHPGDFIQMMDAFSPRPGMGASDAIPFNPESAAKVTQHLQHHAVFCHWIAVRVNRRVSQSVLIASDKRGLERGLHTVDQLVRQIHGDMVIKA